MMFSTRPTPMESSYNGSWTVDEFALSSASLLDVDDGVGVSIANVEVNQTQKSIRELLYNGTGYYIEDELETGG